MTGGHRGRATFAVPATTGGRHRAPESMGLRAAVTAAVALIAALAGPILGQNAGPAAPPDTLSAASDTALPTGPVFPRTPMSRTR